MQEESATLQDAVKEYVIYLHSIQISPARFAAYMRVLCHVMKFYGDNLSLEMFSDACVLRYADIYDPWHANPLMRERGQLYWKFVHWLKKNDMIPAFTADDKH